MNQYLLDYFLYNDQANRKLLETILQLPEPTEALKLFSHLITSQDKWYNRVSKERNDTDLTWFGPVFGQQAIEHAWNTSFEKWRSLLVVATDETLDTYIFFTRQSDGKKMKVKLKDIVFQLNCHSVHHRAQINKLISCQGLPVPNTDYIFSALSEVE